MELKLFIGVIGAFASIIGIVAAYIFYRTSLRIKIPQFALESVPIIKQIKSDINDLKIIFRDKQIKNLTISRLAIWNAGKEPIYKKDVPSDDKFKISPEEGYNILKAEIIKIKNRSNKWHIEQIGDNIFIDFEYFDFKEGCTIQIFHTGKSSWSLKVDGSVIGAGKLIQASHISFPKRRRKALIYSIIVFVLLSLITILSVGLVKSENFLKVYFFIALFLYTILPMIFTIKYMISKRTSLELGVKDDDELLRAPDFPPTGKIRERDKDADPYII